MAKKDQRHGISWNLSIESVYQIKVEKTRLKLFSKKMKNFDPYINRSNKLILNHQMNQKVVDSAKKTVTFHIYLANLLFKIKNINSFYFWSEKNEIMNQKHGISKN